MTDINISIEGGTSKRLLTAGKYCDKDIVITAEGGGGDESLIAFLSGTLEEIDDDVTTKLRQYMFYENDGIKHIRFSACTTIESYALRACGGLESIDFPVASGGSGAYFCASAQKLTSVNIPNITSLGNYTFQYCYLLQRLDLPRVTSIGTYFLRDATVINAVILRASQVVTISTGALTATAISKGNGYIYVPRALVEDYKVAANWSTYASQFRALEDYTADGTITGELDESKI